MKISASNIKIGDYLNPLAYRERFINRAMDENDGIYSLSYPFPSCGMEYNEINFRMSKMGQTFIHTYFKGELVKIERIDFKWNKENKNHDQIITLIDKAESPCGNGGSPFILRLDRYLNLVRNSHYQIMSESARGITLYKRNSKGNKKIFTISKWTGKLIGKHNRE